MKEQEGTGVERTKPSLNSVVAQRERRKRIAEAADTSSYTATEEKIVQEAGAMSLIGHLEELRKRIIISVLFVVLGFAVCYYYVDSILAFLIAPAGKLYYMRPTEAFFTYMKVAMVCGVLMVSPILLHQAWSFIRPALTTREKSVTNWILPVAILLFTAGILFAFYLVLPAAVRFFIGFATDELQPMFSVGQYIDFIIALILPFGVIFELPIIVYVLAQFGIISASSMANKRKYFILIAFIIGGVISPTPDVFSQSLIALPMIALYQISIWMLRMKEKRI